MGGGSEAPSVEGSLPHGAPDFRVRDMVVDDYNKGKLSKILLFLSLSIVPQ